MTAIGGIRCRGEAGYTDFSPGPTHEPEATLLLAPLGATGSSMQSWVNSLAM